MVQSLIWFGGTSMVKREIREISRGRNLRSIKKNIYISCEGDAEENYLKGLKKCFSRKANIKISNSKRTAAKDVVKNLITRYKSEYQKGDLKYCIFDSDENSKQALDDAKKLADKIGAKIIYSNPCFEIWLLWHYEKDFSIQDSRENLKRKIEHLIKIEYWNSVNLYDIVNQKLNTAQMNYLQRKAELENYNIPFYSKESNPYTNFDELLNDLFTLK